MMLREISGDMVVTAPCAASCEIASSLANRFGIIVGRRKWVNQMHAVVRENGYEDRLSGFYHVELGVNEFQRDHDETFRRLLEAGRKAVEEDYAEALILGCTLEFGFYREMEEALGVPVIDPSIAALKRAEYGALLKRGCGWVPSRMWVLRRRRRKRKLPASAALMKAKPSAIGSLSAARKKMERYITMPDAAQKRLAALRAKMSEQGADLLALGPGHSHAVAAGVSPSCGTSARACSSSTAAVRRF